MDFTFPDKYFHAAAYFDFKIGDIETSTALSDEQKLLFYALRQQAEKGPCTGATPPLWHVRERYKHQAWSHLGGMSKFEAMVAFVRHYEEEVLGGAVNWMAATAEIDAAQRCTTTAATTSAAGSEGWDADIEEHMAPSKENIAYLAAQLMQARQLLRQQRAPLSGCDVSAAATVRHSPTMLVTSESERVTVPQHPPPNTAAAAAATVVDAVPVRSEGAAEGRVVPPSRPLVAVRAVPVRVSPQCIVMEASRQANAPLPEPPSRGKGWAEWLGQK